MTWLARPLEIQQEYGRLKQITNKTAAQQAEVARLCDEFEAGPWAPVYIAKAVLDAFPKGVQVQTKDASPLEISTLISRLERLKELYATLLDQRDVVMENSGAIGMPEDAARGALDRFEAQIQEYRRQIESVAARLAELAPALVNR